MSSDPVLKNLSKLPGVEAPLALKDEGPLSKLKRVGRPIRELRKIPTKQLVFYSKNKEPTFTYDIKYKLPVKKHNIVIQVKAVGLNPVDLKIINSYTSNFNSFRGIGREYSGVITHVGSDHAVEWKEGEEVCGIFFHPNGFGTLASSIQIDPSVDSIIRKPKNLSFVTGGSWIYTFGAAYQLLNTVKNLNQSSRVLINGGSSSVGLMLMQILKTYFKVEDIVSIVAGSALDLVKRYGTKLAINYKVNPDIPHVLEVLTATGIYKDFNPEGEPTDTSINSGKFDLVIDCIGGYTLVEESRKFLKSSSEGGKYITLVGDVKYNYSKDIYNDWNGAFVNARSMFGTAWSINYTKFEFNPRDKEFLPVGAEMLENGEIVNVIDSVYEWSSFTKAAKKLKAGAHGKIVLQVEDF